MITLRGYQQRGVTEIRGAYSRGFHAPLYVAPCGAGKCLAAGTPVLMYDGTIKPVEDVREGDLLMGPDSKPREVLSTTSGMEMMYRIVPKRGEPFTVNESHILSLRIMGSDRASGPDGRMYLPGDIANVAVRDYLNANKTFKSIAKGWRADAIEFENCERELPIPPYILGIWLGDGSSWRPEICNIDRAVITEWEKYAASMGHECKAFQEAGKTPVYRISAPSGSVRGRGHNYNVLLQGLQALNLIKNKHIPHPYKTGSLLDRLELLAGIIDTDGSLGHGHYDVCIKQREMASDIAFLARSLGLASYVKECRKTCTNNGAVGTYWRISICGEIDIIPCRVQRKRGLERRIQKNARNFGFSVEPIGVGIYYGFEIAGPDRLFLLGDFTVTHNTVLFAYIAANARARGNSTIIGVHRQELLNQTVRTLQDFGVPCGVIASGKPTSPWELIHVASVQTLARRLHKIAEPKLLVFDEAHHANAMTWGNVINAYSSARILGVTATPWRMNGGGLDKVFDTMVLGPTVEELIAGGWLAKPVYYAPPQVADFADVKTQAGDFEKHAIADRLDKPHITGDAVSHYIRLCPNVPAVAFCTSIKHADHVAEEFRRQGIPAASIDGSLSDADRAGRIADLASGEIKVLTSCELISEGFDLPAVSAAIMLRPTQSLSVWIQQAGRALRPAPGKERAVILDHVGNTTRLGLMEDEREWTLEGRPKKQKSANDNCPYKRCPKCFVMYSPALRTCPECGEAAVPTQREIEQREGELQELQREIARKQARREVGLAQSLEALSELGRQRGYKHPEGWARHIMAARGQRSAYA